MRIAVNTRFLIGGKLEGIGRFTYELLKVMVARHPEDEFIFFFDRPFDPAFVLGPNVEPVVLYPPARHPLLWYWWFERAIPAALKRYDAELFFSPDGYLSLSTPLKTVMVTHDIGHFYFPDDIPFLVQHYYSYFVPRFLHRADGLITVSNFVKDDIVNIYGIPAEKIAVACNAASSVFSTTQKNIKQVRDRFAKGSDYFLYTGAIHPRKNLDQLIRAFDLFKTKTGAAAKLLISGRMAWQVRPVRKAYEKANFRRDIIFLGFVKEEDLVGLMAAARGFAYVSKHEGFGIPVLEAMQSGVPVICSNTSALTEVAGEAALKVAPDNAREMAEAMEKIWSDPDLREQLIRKGFKRSSDFSWEKAESVVYRKLLEAARQ